jgi:hypothetical protein
MLATTTKPLLTVTRPSIGGMVPLKVTTTKESETSSKGSSGHGEASIPHIRQSFRRGATLMPSDIESSLHPLLSKDAPTNAPSSSSQASSAVTNTTSIDGPSSISSTTIKSPISLLNIVPTSNEQPTNKQENKLGCHAVGLRSIHHPKQLLLHPTQQPSTSLAISVTKAASTMASSSATPTIRMNKKWYRITFAESIEGLSASSDLTYSQVTILNDSS